MTPRILIGIFLIYSCQNHRQEQKKDESHIEKIGVKLVVLGTVQDAGSPHIACKKSCCRDLFATPDPTRQVTCLGLIDFDEKKTFLFEASPDFSLQCKTLQLISDISEREIPDGILITHAHIGHYTGLMYLGKEGTNARKTNVFAMPKFKSFLENNGPWSQLVNDSNIMIQAISNQDEYRLSSNISIKPIRVPHRDEYSETVAFLIHGPNKSALFIPDIDKWEKWEFNIIDLIAKVDYALLDGTFYSGKEINNRDISQIPHPFIIESMEKFKDLSPEEKSKIHFIHFNHTNPLLDTSSVEYSKVIKNGFKIARYLDEITL